MERRSHGEGTFKKRSDGRLEYSISIGYNNIEQKKRKSFYGKNKSECIYKYKEYLQKNEKNCLGNCPTLYVWMTNYINTYRVGIKESTLSHYISLIENYIKPSTIANMPLHAIKPLHIQKLINQYSYRSQSHLGKLRDLISSSFECAIDNEFCTKNPCKNISIENRIKRASFENTFSSKECTLIRDYCLASSDRMAFAVLILLYTGMRQGELLGLQWNDIDWDNNHIYVTRTSCVDSKCKKYISPQTKTQGSTRNIYILPQLHDILLQQEKTSIFIVSTRSGDFYNSNSFNKMHKRFISKISGVRSLGTHAYRHALITHLGNAGASLDDIARIVGHDDPSLTRKVYFFNDGSKSREVMRLLPY